MSTRALSVEILQQRSDAIILGMRKAVDNGMNPKFFRHLEDGNPRKHRDLVQVYLGIKPCATYLTDVMDYYDTKPYGQRDNIGHLKFFPTADDTGITVLTDSVSCSVWNPEQVTEILANHRDLKDRVQTNPSNRDEFGDLLGSFYDSVRAEDILLQGVILGYPRSAVEAFVNYYGTAIEVAQQIWQQAIIRGACPQTYPPEIPLFDLHDAPGIYDPKIKREFVRLARLIGYPNIDVINYIEGLRVAEVPGWQFFTSGDFTLNDENKMREQFAASQFDTKFAGLLKDFGV